MPSFQPGRHGKTRRRPDRRGRGTATKTARGSLWSCRVAASGGAADLPRRWRASAAAQHGCPAASETRWHDSLPAAAMPCDPGLRPAGYRPPDLGPRVCGAPSVALRLRLAACRARPREPGWGLADARLRARACRARCLPPAAHQQARNACGPARNDLGPRSGASAASVLSDQDARHRGARHARRTEDARHGRPAGGRPQRWSGRPRRAMRQQPGAYNSRSGQPLRGRLLRRHLPLARGADTRRACRPQPPKRRPGAAACINALPRAVVCRPASNSHRARRVKRLQPGSRQRVMRPGLRRHPARRKTARSCGTKPASDSSDASSPVVLKRETSAISVSASFRSARLAAIDCSVMAAFCCVT